VQPPPALAIVCKDGHPAFVSVCTRSSARLERPASAGYNGAMSLRSLVGLSIWAALFLLAFAASLRLLPSRPLMTVVTGSSATLASLSPDGKLLMTQAFPSLGPASVTESFRLWSVPDGGEQRLAGPGGTAPVSPSNPFPSFSPDRRLILDRRFLPERKVTSLRFIEINTGQEWLHVESVSPGRGCLSADGRKLACFATDHVEVWDVPNRRMETTLKAGPCFAISADGATVLCDVALDLGPDEVNEEMALWDVSTQSELCRVTVLNQTTWQVEFSPDGRSLGFSCLPLSMKGGFFKVWDVTTGRIKIDMPWVSTFAFVLGGKALATTGGFAPDSYCSACFWDVDTGEELTGVPLGEAGRVSHAFLKASREGHWLAVEIDSEPSGRRLPKWSPRWKWLSDVWEGDGELVQVAFFDTTTKQERGRISSRRLARYEFSPDNSTFVVARLGGVVDVWDVPPRKPIWLAAALAGVVVGLVLAIRLGYRRFRRPARLSVTEASYAANTPSYSANRRRRGTRPG
jgi:WD40 repeat protein